MSFSIAGKKIGGGKVFIIAEAGSNHDGNLDVAKKLIDVAADAGADAVKFQTFRASHLYVRESGSADYLKTDESIYEIIRKMEMPYEWLPVLSDYSRDKGLVFLSTPFDEQSADELEKAGRVPAFKTGSYELTHIPFLEHLAQKKKPLIVSTGMANFGEVDEALETIRNAGNPPVALLHCIAAYPAPLEDCNLRAMQVMGAAFGVEFGLSDHTMHPTKAPAMACALGASVVEKHFTLSRSREGPDHKFALEPGELKQMVAAIREVSALSEKEKDAYVDKQRDKEILLGSPAKKITKSELELAAFAKRYVYVIKNIAKGEAFSTENIRVLRSGKNPPGLHPRFWKLVLGKHASRPVAKNSPLLWEHLLS
ncbi:MAG: N-acetylneuraminate synthase family protein [Candidatus Micrarchaeota archaeon]